MKTIKWRDGEVKIDADYKQICVHILSATGVTNRFDVQLDWGEILKEVGCWLIVNNVSPDDQKYKIIQHALHLHMNHGALYTLEGHVDSKVEKMYG